MRPRCKWARLGIALTLGLLVGVATGAAPAKKETKKTTTKAAKKGPAKPQPASAEKASNAKPVAAAKSSPARATPAAANMENEWAPMPATTGGLGLFTLETGTLLPQGKFSGSAFVNKFSREPGSLGVLNVGWSVAVGLHDRFNAIFQFEPHRHIHVGMPNRLSFNSPITNPQFGTTIYRSLLPIAGSPPAYAEDFPFASGNRGGVGEIMLGTRFALAQRRMGHPFDVAFGYDFFIPTRTQLVDLLDSGVQMGTFSHGPSLAISTKFGNMLVTTINAAYRFTNDHRFGTPTRAFLSADQLRLGAGLLFFPERRWQIMNEYNALIFLRDSTPTITFGARDPIDGIWGARLYVPPWNNVAFDVGYRYALNLQQHGDRNGFVIKVGTSHWEKGEKKIVAPPNRAPAAACSVDKSSVYAGSDDLVRVTMRANDADNDTLSYSWSASGGRVEGTGAEVRWTPGNAAQGLYTITGRVEDGHGGTASCAVDVRVEPRPNRAPTLSCSADRSTVLTGERVRISASAGDPDGDTLKYSWRSNAGQIVGSGSTVQLDTSNMAPGRYNVTGRVEDGRGGAADCSVSIGVQPPPPPPQAAKLNECFFRAASARVDNVCKRIMDDVALRLQNDPRARVVIVGYADPSESPKLGAQRAEAAKKYLVGKGIAAARVDTRAGTGQAGAGKQNRRVDVIWLPEGATY